MVKILISTPLRRPGWFINLLARVLAFAATTLPTAQSFAAQPVHPPACLSKTSAQQQDVSERAALFKSGDGLYASLVRLFGPPASCRGDSSPGEFGTNAWVEFRWRSGLSIKLEVQPIETSIVSVSNPAGLAQAAVLTEQLRDYSRARGLSVDWSRPTTNTEGAHTIQEYQDPEPGLNGIVRLRHDRDGRLVAMSLSVAL